MCFYRTPPLAASVKYKEQIVREEIKGTLMQILKSPYMFLVTEKYYPENFAFWILIILELFTSKVCKTFVYKHTETIEYVNK